MVEKPWTIDRILLEPKLAITEIEELRRERYEWRNKFDVIQADVLNSFTGEEIIKAADVSVERVISEIAALRAERDEIRTAHKDATESFLTELTSLHKEIAALAHTGKPTVSGAKKIYLASRYSRAEQLRAYRDELERMGYTVTSRWIEGGHELTKEGSTEAVQKERTRFAQEDWADMQAADCVISFTEEPRKTNTRGGRHVEFGGALAAGKRCIVVGWRENVFHCLPQVEFFDNWGDCLSALQTGGEE